MKPVTVSVILMALLLTKHSMSAAPTVCSGSRDVTVQISKSHIVRTWQPDGDCQRWQNGRSETNRFPAAVQSGPRWLVMQLRQPMVLDRVSMRGWDDQWQAAGAVGSPVSAVGAASLPLELQLEDPCRASWEAFNSSDRWRQLGGSDAETPVSFLRMSSWRPLSWQAVSVSGRHPLMQLNRSLSGKHLYSRYGLISNEDAIELYLNSCGNRQPVCWLQDAGRTSSANVFQHLGSEEMAGGMWTHKLKLALLLQDHGMLLQCGWDREGPVLLEKLLLLDVLPTQLSLSVSPVLVAGFPAAVRVFTDSLPEFQHRCFIRTLESQRNLSIAGWNQLKVLDSKYRTLIRVESEFKFNVSAADANAEIVCSSGTAVVKQYNVSDVSDPCLTAIHLGPSRHWQVGETRNISVTSSQCSIWNVSHTCWLELLTGAPPVLLLNVKQGEFNSTHELQVSEAMAPGGWKVRCSVNQSGVVYPDSESDSRASPAVFGNGDKASIASLSGEFSNRQLIIRALVRGPSRLPVSVVNCSAAGRIADMEDKGSGIWHGMLQLDSSNCSICPVCCSVRQTFSEEQVFYQTECNPGPRVKAVGERADSTGNGLPTIYVLLSIGIVLAALAAIGCSIWVCILPVVRRGAAGTASTHVRSRDRKSSTQLMAAAETTCSTELHYVPVSISDSNQRDNQHVAQAKPANFVSVVRISVNGSPPSSSCSDDSDDDQAWLLEATGHYESDGCTFRRYRY